MLEAFFGAIKDGKPSPIDFDSLYETTKTTFKILESIRTNSVVKINE